MSRRGGTSKAGSPAGEIIRETSDEDFHSVDKKATAVGSLQLDGEETAPLSVEERYEAERNQMRIKKWKESPFAQALTEVSWMEERRANKHRNGYTADYADDYNPDTSGCLCCSAMVCPLFGAGRVGNMVVLKTSSEWVEETGIDDETGEESVRRYTRPKLDIVVGPFWPMLVFVTYPIIIGVSMWTLISAIIPGGKHPLVVLGWAVCTVGLILALAFTGCRDPGILYRHENPPPQEENSWRWNDRALTYRPRHAHFDSDTGIVVEGFDHTCPWTGTAIGKKNMPAFQMFVCLVFVCLVLNILLMTGVL